MRLAEVFLGFDGEVSCFGQGTPSVFIRFAGCNLQNCSYCDTKQWLTLQSGMTTSVENVLRMVKELEKNWLKEAEFKKVTITGGEPLLQFYEFWKLVNALGQEEWNISVETNGSMPLFNPSTNGRESHVDCWVVDYKLPSSNMMDYMMPINSFGILGRKDFIKFVIQNEKDFECAKETQMIIQTETLCKARFAYSPCWGKFDVQQLADVLRISSSEILGNCIINYQLHKLWGDPEKENPENKNILM